MLSFLLAAITAESSRRQIESLGTVKKELDHKVLSTGNISDQLRIKRKASSTNSEPLCIVYPQVAKQLLNNIDLSNTYLLLLSNIAELRGRVAAWLLYYLVNNLDIFPRKVEKYEY